jgi:hypothetical protein
MSEGSSQSSLVEEAQEEGKNTEEINEITELLLAKYFIRVDDGDDGGKCRFCIKPNPISYVKNGHSNLVKHLQVNNK